MDADLPDAFADGIFVVVVLECGLGGEGMGAGVFGKGATYVDGGQVAPERHRASAYDGIQWHSQFTFQVVEAEQPHLEHQFGGHHP